MAEQSDSSGRRLLADSRTRLTVEFALLLLGAELMRHVAYPARLAGIGFAAAAVAWGVRAYLASRPTLRRGAPPTERGATAGPATLLFVAVGLGLAGLLLVWHAALATPLVVAYDQCRAEALTRAAEQRCTADFQEGLQQWGTR